MKLMQFVAPVFAVASVLSLFACGGSGAGNPDNPRTPSRLPVNGNSFAALTTTVPCADVRNRFYVIDQKFVFQDSAGNCADATYTRTLYGATPQEKLCVEADSIGGPQQSCDPAYRDLFTLLKTNRDKPDLGLGAAHKVEALPQGTVLASRTIDDNQISGITVAQNLIIKDSNEWARVWALHNANVTPARSLPAVDFSKKMVVAMFDGSRPNGCYVFGDLTLSRMGNALRVVHVSPQPPAGGVCTQVITAPSRLVEVDRFDGAAKFVADPFSF
jgi:hypothetical protein